MANIINFFNSLVNKKTGNVSKIDNSIQASVPIYSINFNGEKNLGEIGAIKYYGIDHDALALRSWQAFLESEIVQLTLGRYITWTIGSGLKLQADPEKLMLSNIDEKKLKNFSNLIEAKWRLWAKSKKVDHQGQMNLTQVLREVKKNVAMQGDTLVILRVIKKRVTVQVFDSYYLQTPIGKVEGKGDGNEIINGIEFNTRGEHVAYWVRVDSSMNFKRIKAKSKKGLTMAYMVYGKKYRSNCKRGIPLFFAVLESLNQLQRYKDATISSAEEQAKIALQAIHDKEATGENPLQKILAKATADNSLEEDISIDSNGKPLSDQVAATHIKQFINNPPGTKLEAIQSNKDKLYFKEFFGTGFDVFCASIGIPPEVALSKYDSNFSASRAALKDWEHTINVDRNDTVTDVLQPIYDLWLHISILTDQVTIPGYLEALNNKDEEKLSAYRNCRFIGNTVPHIDPLKEVNAERAKLGDLAKSIPLTTVEKATEALNGGEADSNMLQYSEELKRFGQLDNTSASD